MELDPRCSDEATGLPPLDEVVPGDSLLVVAWVGGVGVATVPGNPEVFACRYLSVRGLMLANADDPQSAHWGQLHLAVPVEHAVDVAAALASGGAVDDTETGANGGT